MFKETCFYHHTFVLFMCDDLSFVNSTQKTLKPSKKNVLIPRIDEKKLHTREFRRNMRCKLLQKRSTRKATECSKHLQCIAIEKDIFSELNRCIFQICLKYFKLVIPKILFILVLCSFNFYFKIMWPPFPLNRILPPHQNKNSWPPRKDFSQTFNPPSPKLGGVHALAFIWYFIRTILSEEPCQKQGIWEKI